MIGSRMLYGLDRLPSTLALDDPRLPAVDLGGPPLRLNSVPLPADAWDAGAADHPARVAAVRSWLLAGCGDYHAALRRGVARYLDAVEAHLMRHRDPLAADLARFQGLYRVEDWYWSALRPLPRAWWQRDGVWQRAELAFWNGDAVITMRAGDFATGALPDAFQRFWTGEILPVSPFRRPFPSAPDGVAPVPGERTTGRPAETP